MKERRITMKGRVIVFFCFLLFSTFSLVSCSETEEETTSSEFTNWLSKNDEFMDELVERYKANPTAWVRLKKNLQDKVVVVEPDEVTDDDEDYVYAEILSTGSSTSSILYTDSVRLHYFGHLIPTEEHPNGYVFDQSFSGDSWADFNARVAVPRKFAVNAMVVGFSTALQKMHVGDTWKVYIPYQLGYGTSDSGVIPAYSTLIFYVNVAEAWHVGEKHS